MNKDLENFLWSGESAFCKCGHHIEDHITNGFPEDLVGKTVNGNQYNYATCLYRDVEDAEFRCHCKEFRPYKTL